MKAAQKKEKTGTIIVGIVVGVLLIIYSIYNIIENCTFFHTPFSNILTIGIAIFIAYYWTQRKNDERKLKEQIEAIVDKVQLFATSESALFHEGGIEKNKVYMLHKNISNKIEILEMHKKKMMIEKEVDALRTQFDAYRDFVGVNIEKYEILSASDDYLRNFLQTIEDKCDRIKLNIYK